MEGEVEDAEQAAPLLADPLEEARPDSLASESPSTESGEPGLGGRAIFRPAVKTLQRIALYETKSRFYLVGSNNTQTSFRVLKIDRQDPKNLHISDDKTIYTNREIRNLLTMIDVGNRSKVGQKIGSGLTKTVSAFGIAGFVRFLEGHYVVLITKRRKVCLIGQHTIYKIEDTSMIYIPHDSVRETHSDEQRYLKMFQSIDLSSNFYFSYSYDLSHTLQHNLAAPQVLAGSGVQPAVALGSVPHMDTSQFSYTSQYQTKFVWNEYLLTGLKDIDPDWVLPVVHGFVDQSNISIYGKPIYLTLIARRSKKYAGTRFLKRGANNSGDVANEVETEQIACDASIGSDVVGNYTSFVHMRGSVAAHWSQDISKIQPKPPIFIETQDPFAETAGKHFNQLLSRYGSPVVVINLVKKRERRKHESLLSDEFYTHIDYLNQFLPSAHRIQYIHFDMARCNKRQDANVMGRLAAIAYKSVKKVGIFHSRRGGRAGELQEVWREKVAGREEEEGREEAAAGMLQTGIIRTNCVDCLDRTNTAQFAVGQCALGFQLQALGVLDRPRLDTDSDCVRMLEEMYEDHGDTLAVQYGGSQLIHRIKTYRKQSPWTSKGNDIMQTMRRYYSNTLSDAEKQNTINLFLGVFVPCPGAAPIWEREHNSDYYLHHPVVPRGLGPLTQWWDPALGPHLPLPRQLRTKAATQLAALQAAREALDDFYRPFELTVLHELFAFSEINHSVRDYMPNFTTDFSPFSARTRLGKKREEMSSSKTNLAAKNPSVAGNSTSSSTTTDDDDDDESNTSEMDEEEEPTDTETSSRETSQAGPAGLVSFDQLFPTMKAVYGVELGPPAAADLQLYRRSAALSRASGPLGGRRCPSSSALPHPLARPLDHSLPCPVPVHDYSRQLLRPVDPASLAIYTAHVRVAAEGAGPVSAASLRLYTDYVARAGTKCDT